MTVPVLTAPVRRNDTSSGNNAGDFALLLVQEWLVACRLELTARCLTDECARTERSIPARVVWNRMVENLGFGPRSPATGGKRSGADMTVLEAVIRRVTEQHEEDVAQAIRNQVLALPTQQQVVVMSKKRDLRFVNKKSLPRSRSAAPSNNAHYSTPEQTSLGPPCSGLRPKSAMVCRSTPVLPTKTSNDESFKVNVAGSLVPSSAGVFHHSAKKAIKTNQRPISAASVLTPHRDFVGTISAISTPPARSPTAGNTLHGAVETVASVTVDSATKTVPHNSVAVRLRANLPHITEATGFTTSPGPHVDGGGDAIDQDEEDDEASQQVPTLSLEEMSGERLHQQFGSISHCAITKLRRVLAKSNACSQELEKSQRTLDKIKARAKLHQLRRVLAEEQTPLLTSTMASLTKEPCSLCLYVFPKMNLTTKVTYKSIIDLRASWAAANGATHNNDEATQQIAEAMSRARMAHLYDEAPVCAFCSQLVLNFSTYRPSSAERRAQRDKERHEAMKSLKDLEAKKRHDLERCDPLDYHSYELNSDVDSDSDVEEVVEVKDDGRPQVVRRRRQQTLRAPVQLGVVSKRLHYDKLRSDSLRMLTLGEWQKIMR